jgi:hypothetical protein
MAVIAGLVGSVPDAAAQRFFEGHHGVLCNPKRDVDIARAEYGTYGVHNVSGSDPTLVQCGAQVRSELAETRFYAIVYDRHSTQDVCCTGYVHREDTGDIVTSGQFCSDNFDSEAKVIDVILPPTFVGVYSIDCSIPPAHPSNGISHVTYWWVT